MDTLRILSGVGRALLGRLDRLEMLEMRQALGSREPSGHPHDEVVVDDDRRSLDDMRSSPSDSAAVRNISATDIESLGRAVAGMEAHSDSYDGAFRCNGGFGLVEQEGADATSVLGRKNVEVADFRNRRAAKRSVRRFPEDGRIAEELLVLPRDENDPRARFLFRKILPIQRGRLGPADLRESSRDRFTVGRLQATNDRHRVTDRGRPERGEQGDRRGMTTAASARCLIQATTS
jgi:hypothetical protein